MPFGHSTRQGKNSSCIKCYTNKTVINLLSNNDIIVQCQELDFDLHGKTMCGDLALDLKIGLYLETLDLD